MSVPAAADGRSDEAARCAGKAVHQREPRLGGRGACEGAAKTLELMTSEQMEAFQVRTEPKEMPRSTATAASAAAA